MIKIIQVNLDLVNEEFREILREEIKNAVADVIKQSQLPPLLTRKEFMELVGIGDTKCAELFNRKDFPVIREFGHPRVPTKALFQWIEANTDWVNQNATNDIFGYRISG